MTTRGYVYSEDYIFRPEGAKLAGYFWESPTPHSPLCLIVHGMAEYGSRYSRLVNDLSDTGWSFAAFDLRGHGRSEGERMRMRSVDQAVDDVDTVLHLIRSRAGYRRPIVLLGHSFGGLASILYVSDRRYELSGLVLSSPAIGMHHLFPFMEQFIRILHWVAPNTVINKPVIPEKLTHDVQRQKEYLTDDMIYKFVGADFLYSMLQGMKKAEKMVLYLDCPLLMIQAGKEWVVDNRKGKAFFDRVKAPEKELKNFEGFYHETFNERERDQPIETLKNFLVRIKERL